MTDGSTLSNDRGAISHISEAIAILLPNFDTSSDEAVGVYGETTACLSLSLVVEAFLSKAFDSSIKVATSIGSYSLAKALSIVSRY